MRTILATALSCLFALPATAQEDIAASIAKAFEEPTPDHVLLAEADAKIAKLQAAISSIDATLKGKDFLGPNSSTTWTDSSGKYHVTARVMKLNKNHVQLEQEDGTLVTLERSRLSAEGLKRLERYDGYHQDEIIILALERRSLKSELAETIKQRSVVEERVNVQAAIREQARAIRQAEIERTEREWEEGREERERRNAAVAANRKAAELVAAHERRESLDRLLKRHDQTTLNNKAIAGGLEYKLEAFDWIALQDASGEPVKADSRWLAVKITVKNNNQEQWLIPRMTLLDVAGKQYGHSSKDHYMNAETFDPLHQLNPGVSATRWMLFDVPANRYYLRVSEGGSRPKAFKLIAGISL